MAKRERKDRQLQKLEAQEKRYRKEKNRQTKRDMYETEEGCLSLDGVRVATNVRSLHIIYYNAFCKDLHSFFVFVRLYTCAGQ